MEDYEGLPSPRAAMFVVGADPSVNSSMFQYTSVVPRATFAAMYEALIACDERYFVH